MNFKKPLFGLLLAFGTLHGGESFSPFIVSKPGSFVAPIVVIPTEGKVIEWDKVGDVSYRTGSHGSSLVSAVQYLKEGIQKMTGQEVAIEETSDLSKGIVLLNIADASEELKKDAEIQAALRNMGEDAYNANEAFFIRSEPARTLIVANTDDGLLAGVVELLESVGYEVLGMGPDWIHVPDYKSTPLVFSLERSGRPGIYIRDIHATSGQHRGVGTLTQSKLGENSAVEPVEASYERWRVGARLAGKSMPPFPGHSLPKYYKQVLAVLREQAKGASDQMPAQTESGFLVAATYVGSQESRPAASEKNRGHLWIDREPEGKVYLSDGKNWRYQNPAYPDVSLDLSLPFVRGIVLEDFKKLSEESFSKKPSSLFVFGTDPEDGSGYATFAQYLKNKNWYPEYLAGEGITFGRPYPLHSRKGLDQPFEQWDPAAPTDTVFAFNNWLLREYDKWIDTLPASEQVTGSGLSKKDSVRCSFYSYNYHDVPPNFLLDPRVRVMIAGFPKHRGRDKWKNFKSPSDIAQAFRILLPREPSGTYWIYSLARYWDASLSGMPGVSSVAEDIQRKVRAEYDSGFRAFSLETDFNFGKMGLQYYLTAQILWNPLLDAKELNAIRDRWLQRAFGSAWPEMKVYYDFLTPQNFKVSSPNNWARALILLDAASKKISQTNESQAQRRIDDLKQFWYFYYLIDTGEANANSISFKEFLWKGQSSYMTAMHMVQANHLKNFSFNFIPDYVGPDIAAGPANYTHEETQAWWFKVMEHWPYLSVNSFSDSTLVDGKKGNEVDLNDLVEVREFFEKPLPGRFLYNNAIDKPLSFLTATAQPNQDIGFKLYWPSMDAVSYKQRDVTYNISRWNPEEKTWHDLTDPTMTFQPSNLRRLPDGKDYHYVEIRYKAQEPGTYRIDVGPGGNMAHLTTLDDEIDIGTAAGERGQTFFAPRYALAQSGAWFYIPKGTKTLDMEIWGSKGTQTLYLHHGLPSTGLSRSRSVDVTRHGAHSISLDPGEDGSLAMLVSAPLSFPVLYSVPLLWAKSPSALLVPRAIAEADGLAKK